MGRDRHASLDSLAGSSLLPISLYAVFFSPADFIYAHTSARVSPLHGRAEPSNEEKVPLKADMLSVAGQKGERLTLSTSMSVDCRAPRTTLQPISSVMVKPIFKHTSPRP